MYAAFKKMLRRKRPGGASCKEREVQVDQVSLADGAE